MISQRDAAAETGMSERRQVTAVRVANVPEEEFDAAVEGDEKTTITKLAKLAPELAPEGAELGRTDQDEERQYWQFSGTIKDGKG